MVRSPQLIVCAEVAAGSCADVAVTVSDGQIVAAVPGIGEHTSHFRRLNRVEAENGAPSGQRLELLGVTVLDEPGALHEPDTAGHLGGERPQ